MPRNVKTTPAAERIRENQRQSRARKRDLMSSMRQVIVDYELQGVKASAEMQRAARAVMRENHLLRAMLAQRGVLPEEIQAVLRPLGSNDVEHSILEASMRRNGEQPSLPPPASAASESTRSQIARAAPGTSPDYWSGLPDDGERSGQDVRFVPSDGGVRQPGAFHGPGRPGDHDGSQPQVLPPILPYERPPHPRPIMSPRTVKVSPVQTARLAAVDNSNGRHQDRNAAEILLELGCPGRTTPQ